MAANDEFPRGWTVTTLSASGGLATVTLPAIVGVSYMLQSLSAELFANTAAGATPNVQVLDGVTIMAAWTIGAVVVGRDEVDLSGLSLLGTPGNSMTIQFNVAVATVVQAVMASGIIL